MKIIHTKQQLIDLATELGTLDMAWHEPDQQDVTVQVKGNLFDNAGFWPDGFEITGAKGVKLRRVEKHVIIKQKGKPVAAVNLATLLAWACGYEGEG